MTETVLLTGLSGYIAKHIAVRLLNSGRRVRGSVRDPGRAAAVRAALAPHLHDQGAAGRLEIVALDLDRDAGWDAALAGVSALVHTASPFPLVQPKDPADLLRPAVEGTRRALEAAARAGVGRVVVTSSSAAVTGRDLPAGRAAFDESDWSDPDHPVMTPYARSKLLAERTAWDLAGRHGLALTAINPVFVQGAPLDPDIGTSLAVVARILAGKDPMLPRIAFPVVHVADVAEAHLRALDRPQSIGQRLIVADETLWFRDMAGTLAAAFPGRRITRREAPDLMIRALALFDPSIRTITPALGRFERVSNARAREVLGIEFRPAREALREAGAWLIANGRA